MKFNNATGAGNQPFNLKIFAGDDDTLKPGALLFESVQLTSPPGLTGSPQTLKYVLPSPVNVATGYYYVGLAQTGSTNISFAFQEESPIRFGDFFYASPVGTNSWVDFASAGADFLLDIEPSTGLELNVGLYLDGFFNGSTMIADTVKVIARSQTAPYAAIDSA